MRCQPFENKKFPSPFALYRLISTSTLAVHVASGKVFRKQIVASVQVIRQVEQFRMVTELLEKINCLQGLRILPAKQGLDFGRLDKKAVQLELEIG